MLSSTSFKFIVSLKQKKIRIKEGKFLIEGFHLIKECLNSDFKTELIIISEELTKYKQEPLSALISAKKIPIHFIKKHQFKKLAETENSQGIIAVVNKKKFNKIHLNSLKLLVALDKISDPGNLGTIIRTSYWFNADAIMLSTNSVDLYNSKVIRSTQGALFHIKIYENMNFKNELVNLQSNGFKIVLFDLNAEKDLKQISFFEKNVFVFGNEAGGISDDILKLPFEKVKIKSFSNCESLNVSISSGIALNYYRMLNL